MIVAQLLVVPLVNGRVAVLMPALRAVALRRPTEDHRRPRASVVSRPHPATLLLLLLLGRHRRATNADRLPHAPGLNLGRRRRAALRAVVGVGRRGRRLGRGAARGAGAGAGCGRHSCRRRRRAREQVGRRRPDGLDARVLRPDAWSATDRLLLLGLGLGLGRTSLRRRLKRRQGPTGQRRRGRPEDGRRLGRGRAVAGRVEGRVLARGLGLGRGRAGREGSPGGRAWGGGRGAEGRRARGGRRELKVGGRRGRRKRALEHRAQERCRLVVRHLLDDGAAAGTERCEGAGRELGRDVLRRVREDERGQR